MSNPGTLQTFKPMSAGSVRAVGASLTPLASALAAQRLCSRKLCSDPCHCQSTHCSTRLHEVSVAVFWGELPEVRIHGSVHVRVRVIAKSSAPSPSLPHACCGIVLQGQRDSQRDREIQSPEKSRFTERQRNPHGDRESHTH